MVICHVKLTCKSCGHWYWAKNSSGNKDGYLKPYDCPHFHSSIYCSSTQGWAFGLNAMAKIELEFYCKKCNRSGYSWRKYYGYGTDYDTYNFKCDCGNTLHIKWDKS